MQRASSSILRGSTQVETRKQSKMCRSAGTGMQCVVDRDEIKIRGFCVRLILSNNSCINQQRRFLPDSLTLLYLPRITGSPLHIDGSSIRPDSPAFITLHRVLLTPDDKQQQQVAYVSKDRVTATEGVRYEVYLGDVKLLNGVFRRHEDDEWVMGCKCLLEEEMFGLKLAAAEVCIAAEGMAAVCEKVEMVVRRRRRNRKIVMGLEDIPEAKEEDCYCCCCDHDEEEEVSGGAEGELTEIEDVGWAVDVGLWVMCFGVGLLVSKASYRRLRSTKFF